MSAAETIRELVGVIESYQTHLGVENASQAAGIFNRHIPADYRGIKKPAVLLEDACNTLIDRVDRGAKITSPANFVLGVFRNLISGKGIDAERRSSNGNQSGSGGGDDFARQAIREMDELERPLFADRVRNARVEAIESWRRTRFTSNPDPTPHWALGGFDSPEAYRDRGRGVYRAPSFSTKPETRPKKVRELGTIADAIEQSQDYEDQAILNEDDE